MATIGSASEKRANQGVAVTLISGGSFLIENKLTNIIVAIRALLYLGQIKLFHHVYYFRPKCQLSDS